MAEKKAEKKTDQQIFLWEGTNRKGERVSGETPGKDLNTVRNNLRKQGILVKKVKKKPKDLFAFSQKITAQDICVFSRQMSTMMQAGIPLVQSFDIVSKSATNPNLANLINTIKNDIESGNTFAESLAKHPKYFSNLFCNLIAAGEASGTLEAMLNRVATYLEKTEQIKAKIKKALIYPVAVIVVAFGVTACLMIFVVPQFQELFSGFGADLPAPTKFVVWLSDMFQAYWYFMVGTIVGIVILIIHLKNTSEGFRRGLDRFMLRIPVFGMIVEKAIIARITRTLGITFAAGLPLVDALESVAGAASNSVFSDAILNIREEVSTGQQLQTSMKNTNLFPNMVIQMVSIGEEAGSLEEMLSKVATFYEEEVDVAVDSLSSLLEPFILVFLGGMVGGLVVAMYLPIFKMGSVV